VVDEQHMSKYDLDQEHLLLRSVALTTNRRRPVGGTSLRAVCDTIPWAHRGGDHHPMTAALLRNAMKWVLHEDGKGKGGRSAGVYANKPAHLCALILATGLVPAPAMAQVTPATFAARSSMNFRGWDFGNVTVTITNVQMGGQRVSPPTPSGISTPLRCAGRLSDFGRNCRFQKKIISGLNLQVDQNRRHPHRA